MFARHRNLAAGGVISVTIGFVGTRKRVRSVFCNRLGITATEAGAVVLIRVLTYALGVPAAFLLISRQGSVTEAVIYSSNVPFVVVR